MFGLVICILLKGSKSQISPRIVVNFSNFPPLPRDPRESRHRRLIASFVIKT